MPSRPTVALATCRDLPDLDPDDQLVLAPLTALGVDAAAVVWDDSSVDWSRYDLVVVRSCWDYVPRRDEFAAWARSVQRLANPADVIVWNTDKRYLDELGRAGVPVVPTTWVGPDDDPALPDDGQVVVKPSVGAGSLDTGRYDLAAPGEHDLAVAHVRRLQAAGRTAMVQPYLTAVDTDGERSLLVLGGEVSHSITKGAMLAGPDERVDGLYRPETITPRTSTAAEHEVALAALRAVPGGPERLLYARVDLIDDDDGDPRVLEVELTEPSVFLGHAPGSAERFARAIADLAMAAPAR